MAPEPTITQKSVIGTAFTQAPAAWVERATLYQENARLWIRDAASGRVYQVDLPNAGLLELQAMVVALRGEVYNRAAAARAADRLLGAP